MAKQGKEIKDLIFNCSTANTNVHLKVEGVTVKGFFGAKFTEQVVKKCDLQAQGGCTVKLEPAATSKCPAVIKSLKSALK